MSEKVPMESIGDTLVLFDGLNEMCSGHVNENH